MTSVEETILELFRGSQDTTACHQKNSLLMRKMYRKVDFEQFRLALLRPIYGILEIDFKQKNPYVDRMIEFVGQFCSTLKNTEASEDSYTEEPIISALFEYLLQATKSSSDIVRFRACQLINKILHHLIGGEISDDLFELMQDVLIERLSDSKGVIRLQAIEALYRLQDPSDPEDPLISEFIQLMHDTQAKVRKLCVEKIACRQDVIRHLVQKTRDIDANVRLAAFKRLTKFPIVLKITDRRSLLFTALFGQINKVKDYVFTEFLTSWLEVYDNNIVSLMKSLRLDADEEDIDTTSELYGHVLNKFYFKQKSVKELVGVLPLNDEKLLPYDELNWETVTYWRHLVALLAKNVDSEFELNVSPEIVFLCRYIKGYSEFSAECSDEGYLEKQYIIKQLFHIMKNCDMGDTHSMKSIHALVDYIVKKEDLMDDTVEIIIGTLELTIPNPEARCRLGMEIVSDILSPVNAEEELRKEQDRQFELSKLKVRLDVLQADQEEALAKADYMEAQRLKLLIEDVSFRMNDLRNAIYTPVQDEPKKKTDVATVCKCLDIVWAILRCANISHLTPTLKSMKTDFLPELLVHNNEIIRLKALRCYAICCIMDKPTAQQGVHIFALPIAAYQAGEECDTQTLKMCIAAISDLLRIYGADLMAEPGDDQLSESVDEEHQKVFAGGTSLTSLVQGLVDLMDDEQMDIQLKACEGLCKLILDERIYSAPLISRLTLKWCQPAAEDEPQSENLKQFIGHVLERLSSLAESSEQMEAAVLLTINTLAKAPRNSPLADVDIDNIAKFMLALCKVSPKGKTMHCNIALELSKNINRNPEEKINAVYSKMLLMLDLPEDQSILEEIFTMIDEAREYIEDKTASKNITKLLSILSEMLRGDKDMSVIAEEPEQDDDEEVEGNVENMEE